MISSPSFQFPSHSPTCRGARRADRRGRQLAAILLFAHYADSVTYQPYIAGDIYLVNLVMRADGAHVAADLDRAHARL